VVVSTKCFIIHYKEHKTCRAPCTRPASCWKRWGSSQSC